MRLRWNRLARRGFYAAVLGVGCALVVGFLAQQVGWSASDGRIDSLRITADLLPDGKLQVTERVALRFDRPEARPAVERKLRMYDELRDGRVRPQEITDLALTDGSGAELGADVVSLLRDVRLRFELAGGAKDGFRSYILKYKVSNAITGGKQGELNRDFAGDGLGVPVGKAIVVVDGPIASTAGCMTGPPTARRFCATTRSGGLRTVFSEPQLGATDGLQIQERFLLPSFPAAGPVAEPEPEAYGVSIVRRVALVMLLLLLIGALAMWRQTATPRSWRRITTPPVEARPAEGGVLLSRIAEPWHLAATVLDLARRGFLAISGVPGSDDDVILRQRPAEGRRDELVLYEWSLLLKVFRHSDEVHLSDIRESAPDWSWELLRDIEGYVDETWRHRVAVARAQRLGCLLAMGLGVVAYWALIGTWLTSWPDLPLSELSLGAGVAIAWSAACMTFLTLVPTRSLNVRGRLLYAEVKGFSDYINLRGVDDDEPAIGVWAVALGLRPDPMELPVVEPGDRPEPEPEPEFDWDLDDSDNSDDDDEPGDKAVTESEPRSGAVASASASSSGGAESRGDGEGESPSDLEDSADARSPVLPSYTGRLFDDDDEDEDDRRDPDDRRHEEDRRDQDDRDDRDDRDERDDQDDQDDRDDQDDQDDPEDANDPDDDRDDSEIKTS